MDAETAVVVDIVAPGVGIESTWIGPQNNETKSISGTSMGKRISHTYRILHNARAGLVTQLLLTY
jgi:subtilisin family serine protease